MTAAELKARFPNISEDTIRLNPGFTANQWLSYLESKNRECENTPEKQIQQEIEDWLISLRPHCYFVRSRMDRATTTPVGTCDFLGWINGRPFTIEVKKPGRKPTMEQLSSLKMAESAGAIAAVVHSLKEAQTVIGHLEHLP